MTFRKVFCSAAILSVIGVGLLILRTLVWKPLTISYAREKSWVSICISTLAENRWFGKRT